MNDKHSKRLASEIKIWEQIIEMKDFMSNNEPSPKAFDNALKLYGKLHKLVNNFIESWIEEFETDYKAEDSKVFVYSSRFALEFEQTYKLTVCI